jgi:hypothetical protein
MLAPYRWLAAAQQEAGLTLGAMASWTLRSTHLMPLVKIITHLPEKVLYCCTQPM